MRGQAVWTAGLSYHLLQERTILKTKCFQPSIEATLELIRRKYVLRARVAKTVIFAQVLYQTIPSRTIITGIFDNNLGS